MAVALEDAVLVLLGGRPSSAYEVWQQHTRIFAASWPVDIRRVMTAVAHLERSGLLRIEPPPRARHTSGSRRTCQLTPAGRRRQEEWLCAVTPDLGIDDIYIRGMLAVDAADPAAFDAFLACSLASTRQRMTRLGTPEDGGAAELAKSAFDREMTRALALWLHFLPQYRKSPPASPTARRLTAT
jgi:DNA-binding PadR family transcriptional regulator